MRRALFPSLLSSLAVASLGSSLPAAAAEAWNIPHERALVVRGKVVDLLCQLTGNCPPGCGAGRRQLGLLEADGRLRMVAKGNVDFAGAGFDLAPLCGREIEADGLLIENPAITLYFVQAIRTDPSQSFEPTDAFMKEWTARNGPADEWFRKDPNANRIIAEDGPYGVPGLKPERKP